MVVEEEQRLSEWDARLALRLRQMRLIGELDLTADETAELGHLIGAVVRRAQAHKWDVEARLHERWRHAFVTFLVFQGVHGYQEGEYWPTVHRAIQVDAGPTQRRDFYDQGWGRLFKDILAELGLRDQFGGHVYVGAILGHAGIPTDCLDDFFERLLEPSLRHSELAAQPSPTLIETWRKGNARYVDKPIGRFLEYGGQAATDFVERCRQMARGYEATGATPDSDSLGLPISVVEAYADWQPKRGQAERDSGGPRARRPQLRLDPQQLGVHVWLPQQIVSADFLRADVAWRVRSAGGQQEEYVRIGTGGPNYLTDETCISIEQPAAEYHVELMRDDEVDRGWTLEGLMADRALLAFDTVSGKALDLRHDLPGTDVWLLCGPGLTLDVDNLPITKLARLPWEWRRWQLYAINLAGVSSLTIAAQETRRTYTIDPVVTRHDVYLVGNAIDALSDSRGPLFVGAAPRLRLALNGAASHASMAGWRIEVRPRGLTAPRGARKASLADLGPAVQRANSHVEICLDSPELLDASACGEFELRLRGPLAFRAELPFRVVPSLAVHGHETLYIPDAVSDPPPAHLEVCVADGDDLEVSRGDLQPRLIRSATPSGSVYHLDATPAVERVPFRLTHVVGGDEAVVTFDVPVRRIRWLLALSPEQVVHSAWHSQRLTLQWDELDHAESPQLLLDWPVVDDAAGPCLRLVDGDGVTLRALTAIAPRHGTVWRFELAQARGVLRTSDWATVGIELSPPPSVATQAAWPVLELRRGLCLDGLDADLREDGGHPVLDLLWSWERPLRVKQLAVRLWSRTQPWRPPIDVPLTGDTVDFYTIPLAEPLPAGLYTVEFYVRDRWLTPSMPEVPPEDGSEACTLRIGDIAERLHSVTAELEADPGALWFRAERLLLRRAIDDAAGFQEDLSWFFSRRETVPVGLLLQIAEASSHNATGKAILMSFAKPERIRDVLAQKAAGHLRDGDMKRFLSMWSQKPLSDDGWAALLGLPTTEPLWEAAMRRLVTQRRREGLEAAVATYLAGQVDEAAAVKLLANDARQAVGFLLPQRQDRAVARLLAALAAICPGEAPLLDIQPGCWVHCQAGWGQLDSLETPDGERLWVASREEIAAGARLHVTLRPGPDAERVVIETGSRLIQFASDDKVYICTGCDHFATQRETLFYHHHKRLAHGGQTVGHRRNSAILPQTKPLEFSAVPPSSIWA